MVCQRPRSVPNQHLKVRDQAPSCLQEPAAESKTNVPYLRAEIEAECDDISEHHSLEK